MKKVYRAAERTSYSVFVIPDNINLDEYLDKNYPFKIDKGNLYVIRNKKNKICFLFKDREKCKNKILPERYAINRDRNYTGEILITSGNNHGKIYLNNGVLTEEAPASDISDSINIDLSAINDAKTFDLYYVPDKTEIIKKGCIFFAVFLCAVSMIFFTAKKISDDIHRQIAEQHEIEEQNKLKIQEQKADEKKLAELKAEFEKYEQTRNKKMYKTINLVYNNLDKNCVVESLSIQKNLFQIDVRTKNSLEILSNFEKDSNIEQIKMNRTAIDSGLEYVSYAGKIINEYKEPEPLLSTKEKIAFYENLLKETEHEVIFSEYAKNVRKYLNSNNCSEIYMQVKDDNGLIELECAFKGSGTSIISFVKAIDDSKENIEVKSLRIKNIKDAGLCNANIKFDTHIDIDSIKDENIEIIAYNEANPSDIGKVFKSTAAPKRTAVVSKPRVVVNNQVKTENKIPKKIEKLEYLGKGSSSAGTRLIFVKNPFTGEIYKLPVVNEPVSGDYCLEFSNKYQAFIANNEYEVRK